MQETRLDPTGVLKVSEGRAREVSHVKDKQFLQYRQLFVHSSCGCAFSVIYSII